MKKLKNRNSRLVIINTVDERMFFIKSIFEVELLNREIISNNLKL
jgi:hypothetical protein